MEFGGGEEGFAARTPEGGNGLGAPRVMSTSGSSNRAATWRDFVVLTSVGAVLFGAVATQAGGRSAAIATGAYSIVALMVLAYRYDARETAAEAALREQSGEQVEPEPQPAPEAAQPQAPAQETVPPASASEEPQDTVDRQKGSETFESDRETVTVGQPQAAVNGQAEHHGMVREEEEVGRQAAVATQTISPALYGTGVVDEVSGQIGQVNLLETGLNVLAKVTKSGTINEVNEGMEVVTGVPRDDLLGTDAFSYFTEPDRTKGWFMEALQGSSVRDKEVEVMHQEGETTPLTYNVIATQSNGQAGGVLLCRYRED